jgi:hypothetical protein
VTFCALEGSLLVLIEADSEDDAYAICAAQGLEFHSFCEDLWRGLPPGGQRWSLLVNEQSIHIKNSGVDGPAIA